MMLRRSNRVVSPWVLLIAATSCAAGSEPPGVDLGAGSGSASSSGPASPRSSSSSGSASGSSGGGGSSDYTSTGGSSGDYVSSGGGASGGGTGGFGGSTGSSSGSGPTSSSGSGGPAPYSGSSSGSGSSGGPGGKAPTHLPTVSGQCPTFPAGGGTVTFSASTGSMQAQIWAGTNRGGPLLLYWNGTASSAQSEVPLAFDTNAVAASGGMIVGFNSGTRTGTPTGNTGDAYWYDSDVPIADQAVACAIQQGLIDPKRIHVAGYSAGGLQTVYMWHARSGYVASVISYSGGEIGLNDATASDAPLEDSTNIEPAIAAHGAAGSDSLIVDFANASATWESAIKQAGGFSIDCNDGGNHTAFFTTRAPPLKPVAWQFFLDHPFGVKPEPYTKLPAGFPSYCKID